MEEHKTKKEQVASYKERKITGGVYAIRNTRSGRLLLGATNDLQGSKNRFAFAQTTGSCVDMKLQSDWKAQGGGIFAFDPLEELTKGETQTAEEFKADIEVLRRMWAEKLAGKDLY